MIGLMHKGARGLSLHLYDSELRRPVAKLKAVNMQLESKRAMVAILGDEVQQSRKELGYLRNDLLDRDETIRALRQELAACRMGNNGQHSDA